MMNHLVGLAALLLLLSIGLVACGGGSGGGADPAQGGEASSEGDTEDSGPPLTPGEMSNAGDALLTDGDPVIETPDVQPADDTPAEPEPEGVALISGLWDDSFTYPDGRVNITYLEITADGRYINHDYRGDSFDLGGNCYENIEGVISIEADGSYRAVVLGEEFRFAATAVAGQLQVTFPDGGTTILAGVTGLSTSDFNEC